MDSLHLNPAKIVRRIAYFVVLSAALLFYAGTPGYAEDALTPPKGGLEKLEIVTSGGIL